MRFEETNLIPELLKAVSDAGYETPTRIQEDTIPLALMGRDVLGCAQTGTGKTAAFALPILQRLYLGEQTLYGGRTAGTKGGSPAFGAARTETGFPKSGTGNPRENTPASSGLNPDGTPVQYARTMDEAYGRSGGKALELKTARLTAKLSQDGDRTGSSSAESEQPQKPSSPKSHRKGGRKGEADDRKIRALILTPTRELALQIQESFETYGKYLPLRSVVIFGGVGQGPQVEKLQKGVDILVATPGRLNDLIGQGFISLEHLEIFVLDEADRMLDMGFIHDVRRVMTHLPEVRQTLLFSATMPTEVEALALDLLYQPITVKVNPPTSTVDKIHQTVYFVDKANKRKLLADLINRPEVESALVFVRTKHGADRVARDLTRAGILANSIHGDKSQGARQDALSRFKAGKIKALVATDIAARGIDIFGLSHVFNYDVPNEPETYIHRIGRTGRAGLDGEAATFCCYDELELFRAVEKLINKNIEEAVSPYPMSVFESSGEKIGRPPVGAEKNSRGRKGRDDHGRRERSDDVRKYGHDRRERGGRRFPKEEWFDPETEQVIGTVEGSSFDEGPAKSVPSEGDAPKHKRRRRRKKKNPGMAPETGGTANGVSEAVSSEAESSSPDGSASAAEMKPSRRKETPASSENKNGKKTDRRKAEPSDRNRKDNRKDGKRSNESPNNGRSSERREGGRRSFQEHTQLEDRGSVLKHRPSQADGISSSYAKETSPDAEDDFMPKIVFKNNEKNQQDQPKKSLFGSIFHFKKTEEETSSSGADEKISGKSGSPEKASGASAGKDSTSASNVSRPTDELNKDVLEVRNWLGSRGQRPKVVDRRSSDDE